MDGVRRRWEVAMSRIVVGVHNSLAGLCALRRAVAEARRRGVALHAVRAWPPTPSPRAIAVHHAFSEAMGGIPIDLDVHILVTAGPPGPALVEYADGDDDLLVVGSSQRRWWRRLIGSSVAAYCVRRAQCAVL